MKLWRVRCTLPDRPGALAVLARDCGAAKVNILGLQIFPGVETVTDELVLSTPPDWSLVDIAELIEAAGATSVSGAPCTERALVDQPVRYVLAARSVLAQPASFPEVVAELFDAESDPAEGMLTPVQDVMEMTVGDVAVQVRRTAPFTATEHARGSAMADLVNDVLARTRAEGAPQPPAPGRRVDPSSRPEYVASAGEVSARVDGTVVGVAVLGAPDQGTEPGALQVTLEVDPVWRRRGIGTRLLVEAARTAAGRSAEEIVLSTEADNQAVLPLVLAAGLRGRIRMASDRLTVRIPVRDLRPLPA
ncbi:GNAT family N-acetyltransferase [Nocardioides guangzhouensis]|uniref:GNAT family N-acetyltransferase n=1 Tax=Nocardioides guangzhouensis TaxID=2497878 RepID=A0A4V1XY91_9ACTN|nr:GNAT family N-acetyltransferase [Nocardioides guangzhouensis]RYP82429.1 GNAT family N-acetyltransferase [Nocardioides guangzhouensis]